MQRMRRSNTRPADDEVIRLLRSTSVFEGCDEWLGEFVDQLAWLYFPGGERMVEAGSDCTHLYFVLRGRVRVFADKDGDGDFDRGEIVQELGYAGTIGKVAVLADKPNRYMVQAIRDTEIAALPVEVFKEFAERHPYVWRALAVSAMGLVESELGEGAEMGTTTVAFLPADPGAPLDELVRLLSAAVSAYDTVRDISAAGFDEALGEGAAQDDVDLWDETDRRTVEWITEQERNHHFLIYETDAEYTAWTRRCIRQADRIWIVARADSDSSLTEGELDLFRAKSGAKLIPKELVLIQADDVEMPSGTDEWLARRPGLAAIHHVKLSDATHIERLARYLAGRAVGVVFGGGGARGNAHIGVIEALNELGVPIDAVGGTSAGGGVAAMMAAARDTQRMRRDNHHAFVEMAPFSAYEFPYHSLMKKSKVEAPARWLYGDLNIEDLWLSFFCVSCDLARSETVVHRRGRVWKAVRATTALPVVLPPMHIRGQVLIDGGVVDNTPIAEMKAHNPGPCILVNVSPNEPGLMGDNVIDLPSNTDVLMSILHPFRSKREVPNVGTVIVRTMTMSSSLEASIKMADLYLTPEIEGYGVVDFESMNELVALGYNATMEAFESRRDDEVFLDKFGLKVGDVPESLPRIEVPVWEGERRRLIAARKKRIGGYLTLAFMGAIFGWVLHRLWFTEADTLNVVAFFAFLAMVPAFWRTFSHYLPAVEVDVGGAH